MREGQKSTVHAEERNKKIDFVSLKKRKTIHWPFENKNCKELFKLFDENAVHTFGCMVSKQDNQYPVYFV
jgi:hypothetical protein